MESQRRALSDFQAKEKATGKKGKAKERVGEWKEARPAPMREREEQPQAGPSQIRATSPVAKQKAKMVPQHTGAEARLSSSATGAVTMPGSGAVRAETTVPPRPAVPQPWQSKFHVAVPPPKTSKAPWMHGVPTDEMARLSVHERGEGAREGAGRSHRWLGSLEEEMEIDGEDGSQASKWKRGDEGNREYSDGEDEKEDDRDDKRVEERKVKRPRAGGSKQNIQGTGKYYTPACEPCENNGTRCEKQKKAWACVQCAIKKVACHRGRGEKRKNARDSGPEDDSNDEAAMSDAERSAWQRGAVPSKGPDRKGKGKGKFSFSIFTSCNNKNTEKEPEDVPQQPLQQLDGDAECRADKARIQALEECVKVLETALQKYTQVDVGLGYLDDQQQATERQIEELEHLNTVARERLGEWEKRWMALKGLTSTTTASLAYPACGPPPMPQPLPTVVVVPATPQLSQNQGRAPSLQVPTSSVPPSTTLTSIRPMEPSTMETHATMGPEPNRSVPSPGPEGSPAPQAPQVPEGTPGPESGNTEHVVGNPTVIGADAEMAPPRQDDRMPPSPPWRQSPLPSTNLLATLCSEDPTPVSRTAVDHGPLHHLHPTAHHASNPQHHQLQRMARFQWKSISSGCVSHFFLCSCCILFHFLHFLW